MITLACVAFGVYLTHYLTQKDEKHRLELFKANQNRLPPFIQDRLHIMRALVASGKLEALQAFEFVDRTAHAPFPEAAFLVNRDNKIVAAHFSRSFSRDVPLKFQDFNLDENHIVRIGIFNVEEMKRGHRPPRPPRFSKPPGEVLLIVALAVGVSIIIGIGLSLIVLTYHLRKKARQVEDIMARIQMGDLAARLKIGQADEAGLLMLKFNEMVDEIENLVSNLRRTEESRKILLQELAHDLRTPVASLKNLQETLFGNSPNLTSSQKEQLQSLSMKEVNYFERLVEDLLFLSGVNDPRYKESLIQVNVSELIKEEIEILGLGHLTIHTRLPTTLLFLGDEHLLKRLFRNALSNAGRFAHKNIWIDFQALGDRFSVIIKDDGPGLLEGDLKQFGEKKFSRELRDDHSGHISLGLGSVIMSKIMLLHRGSLQMRNGSEGAELYLNFPLK